MNGSPTLQRLVAACGLSKMFAGNAMLRAIARVGVESETMIPTDLPRVLPEVERAIRPFLDRQEAAQVLDHLRAWAAFTTSVE